MNTAILAGVVAVPVLLALSIVWPLRRRALALAVAGALPGLGVALLMPAQAAAPAGARLVFGVSIGLDPLGRLFLAFTAAVWALAAVHALGYMRDDARRARFAAAFLLAMAGNFGVTIAQDAALFYACFALMSFASYALVVHDGSAFARRAALVYIVLVVAGELLVFPGIVAGARAAGGIELSAIRTAWAGGGHAVAMTLLVLGFSIKAGIAPLHVWLPLAHPAAPTPASAVLSGCMIKAGLLGWLRFLPLGETAMPRAFPWAVAAGAVTTIGGLLAGLTQDHPKAVLAYSSIAKMGTMLLLLSVAMAAPGETDAVIAALGLYAAFHAFNKGALFLGCGVTPGLPARERAGRLALAGLVVLALAFAGAPFLAGAAAKLPLKAVLKHSGLETAGTIEFLLSLSAFATALLMARFVLLTRPGRDSHAHAPARSAAWAWTAAIGAVLAFPAFAARFGRFDEIAAAYTLKKAFAGQLPLVLAAAGVAAWRLRPWRLPVKIPAGDLECAVEAFLRWLRKAIPAPIVKALTTQEPVSARLAEVGGLRLHLERLSRRIEDALANSPAGGAIFILVTVLLILAILIG